MKECLTWNQQENKWTNEGVVLLADEAVNDRVHCGSRSFGYFAVRERYLGKVVLVFSSYFITIIIPFLEKKL